MALMTFYLIKYHETRGIVAFEAQEDDEYIPARDWGMVRLGVDYFADLAVAEREVRRLVQKKLDALERRKARLLKLLMQGVPVVRGEPKE